jgi:hypothetical protein
MHLTAEQILRIENQKNAAIERLSLSKKRKEQEESSNNIELAVNTNKKAKYEAIPVNEVSKPTQHAKVIISNIGDAILVKINLLELSFYNYVLNLN